MEKQREAQDAWAHSSPPMYRRLCTLLECLCDSCSPLRWRWSLFNFLTADSFFFSLSIFDLLLQTWNIAMHTQATMTCKNWLFKLFYELDAFIYLCIICCLRGNMLLWHKRKNVCMVKLTCVNLVWVCEDIWSCAHLLIIVRLSDFSHMCGHHLSAHSHIRCTLWETHKLSYMCIQQMAHLSFCILPWDRCLPVWSLAIAASDNYLETHQHINTHTLTYN